MILKLTWFQDISETSTVFNDNHESVMETSDITDVSSMTA